MDVLVFPIAPAVLPLFAFKLILAMSEAAHTSFRAFALEEVMAHCGHEPALALVGSFLRIASKNFLCLLFLSSLAFEGSRPLLS